jgi:hypothetical protein
MGKGKNMKMLLNVYFLTAVSAPFSLIGCSFPPATNDIEERFFKKKFEKDSISANQNEDSVRYLIDGTRTAWYSEDDPDTVRITMSNIDVSEVRSLFIQNLDSDHISMKDIRLRVYILKPELWFSAEDKTEYDVLADQELTLAKSLVQEIKMPSIKPVRVKNLTLTGTIEITMKTAYAAKKKSLAIAELDINSVSPLRPSATEFLKAVRTKGARLYLIRGACPRDISHNFRSQMQLEKYADSGGHIKSSDNLALSYERSYTHFPKPGVSVSTTEIGKARGISYQIQDSLILIDAIFDRQADQSNETLAAETNITSPCTIRIDTKIQEFTMKCKALRTWSEYEKGYVYWP